MELMTRTVRRGVDATSPAQRADGTSTDRDTMLAWCAKLLPSVRLDANESDRALAFRVWEAAGRSLDELVGYDNEPFRSRSDAYVIARAVGIARAGTEAASQPRTDAAAQARTDADARMNEIAAQARQNMIFRNRGAKVDHDVASQVEYERLMHEANRKNKPGDPYTVGRQDVAPRDKAEQAKADMIARRRRGEP